MLNSKVITLTTFLVVLIAVILSVTAVPAPLSAAVVLKRAVAPEKNDTALQSDSIPVSSTGDGKITPYDENAKIPKKVVEEGNSAEGQNEGQ